MLTIVITPTALTFENLSKELFEVLTHREGLSLEASKKGYKLEGRPEELYKVLLKLSYTYDIELY